MTNSNGDSLGRELKKIRQARGLTRREVSELTSISEESIRRIEIGANSPSFYSLSTILKAYGVDPRNFLSQIEGSSAGKIKDFSQEMDSLINKMEYERAQDFLGNLDFLIENPSREEERDIRARDFLYRGILEKELKGNYGKSLELLEESISCYRKKFKVVNFWNYSSYSPFEKKALSAISLSSGELGSNEFYMEILEELVGETDIKDPQYNLFAINLAGSYYCNYRDEDCKKICQKIIESVQVSRHYDNVNISYYLLALLEIGAGNLEEAKVLGEKALFLTELISDTRTYDFIRGNLDNRIKNK